MNWRSTNGYAKFKVTSLSETDAKLECFSSGWGFMRSWKLEPNEYRSTDGETYSMTLSSHPNKALVLSDKTVHFWGHQVNYYVMGDKSKAVKLFFSK